MKRYMTLAHDQNAPRVVRPRIKATAKFYALTEQDPETKLCSGVAVDGEEVFLLP